MSNVFYIFAKKVAYNSSETRAYQAGIGASVAVAWLYGGNRRAAYGHPYAHIQNVDFIVADAWWYHGTDTLKDERLKLLYPKYQINQQLISAGPAHIKAMHCLPGNRDYEITSEVWDGANSCIFDEAENRLHTEKGILAWFMYAQRKQPSAELTAYHTGKIEQIVKQRT